MDYCRTTLGILMALTLAGDSIAEEKARGPLTDANVFKLIDELRPKAAALKPDGKADDWKSFPSFQDPKGDAVGDTSRDIVRAAIAPTNDALHVMIATATQPSKDDLAFGLNIDFCDDQADDIQIGLSTSGQHGLWVYPVGGKKAWQPFRGAQMVVGDVVAVSVSFADLAKALPAEMAGKLTGPKARPWIRVTPYTWNAKTMQFVDYGPAVASYRLVPTPYDLDAPLPAPGKSPRAINLPLLGQWYVGQGAFGVSSHQNAWAYDLHQVDETLHASKTRDSRRNEDYYSWGKAVVVPATARVIQARNDAPDNLPKADNAGTPVNEALLDLGNNLGLTLGHFQLRGVAVVKGQGVKPEQQLGTVGNSGQSAWPHLHMAYLKLPEGRKTLPMALSKVRVSLNPVPDDPWARDLDRWEIREGVLVERQKK